MLFITSWTRNKKECENSVQTANFSPLWNFKTFDLNSVRPTHKKTYLRILTHKQKQKLFPMVLRILDRSFRASIDDSALLHSSTSPLLLHFQEDSSTSPLLPITMGKKEDSDYDSFSLSRGNEMVMWITVEFGYSGMNLQPILSSPQNLAITLNA